MPFSISFISNIVSIIETKEKLQEELKIKKQQRVAKMAAARGLEVRKSKVIYVTREWE